MNMTRTGLSAALAASFAAASAFAAPRDVKFASFDIDNAVVEMTNFGTETEDLSGWRFCSNNSSVVLRYSGASGFD
ncbi:MAG: hypothetical protein AAGA55_08825, partial [Planctomycetota bacterium]